eukprot:7948158-Heterocapsa_arctica.AAC.1
MRSLIIWPGSTGCSISPVLVSARSLGRGSRASHSEVRRALGQLPAYRAKQLRFVILDHPNWLMVCRVVSLDDLICGPLQPLPAVERSLPLVPA